MTSGQEPVDADPDALTREPLLVAVTHGHVATVDHDREKFGFAGFVDLDGVAATAVV